MTSNKTSTITPMVRKVAYLVCILLTLLAVGVCTAFIIFGKSESASGTNNEKLTAYAKSWDENYSSMSGEIYDPIIHEDYQMYVFDSEGHMICFYDMVIPSPETTNWLTYGERMYNVGYHCEKADLYAKYMELVNSGAANDYDAGMIRALGIAFFDKEENFTSDQLQVIHDYLVDYVKNCERYPANSTTTANN